LFLSLATKAVKYARLFLALSKEQTLTSNNDQIRASTAIYSKKRADHPPLVINVRGVCGPIRGIIERKFRAELLEDSRLHGAFRERKKTPKDMALIACAVKNTNQVRTEIGLNPVCLPAKNIHLIRSDEYDRAFNNEDSEGRSVLRQVFLRCDYDYDPALTMMHLTHELVHAMAFQRYVVFANETVNGNIEMLEWKHLTCGIGNDANFSGLNEVVTEIIAKLIRYRITIVASPFNRRQIGKIRRCGAYWPHILVFTELMKREFRKLSDMSAWLIWDYLTGTNDFLRQLKRKNRIAYKAMKQMTNQTKSAYETAISLGYDDIAAEIIECYAF
jgi:hypothetical protein